MIGYIHLQVDVGDFLILNLNLRNLQCGIELRVLKRSRSICLDAHHSPGVDILRLQRLQLIQTNAGGSKLRDVALLPRPNAHFALHIARGKVDTQIAVNFISSAREGQRRRRNRLIVRSDVREQKGSLARWGLIRCHELLCSPLAYPSPAHAARKA